jgi:hypothetical protein
MVLKPLAFLRYILAQPSRQLGDLIARVLLCVSDVHRKFPTLFRSVFFKDIGRGPTTPAAANTARRSRIRGESFVPADVGRANRQRTRRCGASGILVAGAVRPLECISVGTREQLSTLYRLALAEYLHSTSSWKISWCRATTPRWLLRGGSLAAHDATSGSHAMSQPTNSRPSWWAACITLKLPAAGSTIRSPGWVMAAIRRLIRPMGLMCG